MHLIEFTLTTGKPIYVDPTKVISITEGADAAKTKMEIAGGEAGFLNLTGTVAAVYNLLTGGDL